MKGHKFLGKGLVCKGKLGTIHILTICDEDNNIPDFRANRVDGGDILEDTWHKLRDGEFMVADAEEADEQKN